MVLRALCLLALSLTATAAPCDIYGAAGTPCAAAHSVVRALFGGFAGALYQLKRFGDNATLDVAPLAAGGFANAAAHAAFCAADPPPPPSPPPPPPPSGLPALGTVVQLAPLAPAAAGLAFRHCDSQGFATPASGSGDDSKFTLVAALSGAAGAVSFQSVNCESAPRPSTWPARVALTSAPRLYPRALRAPRRRPGAVHRADAGRPRARGHRARTRRRVRVVGRCEGRRRGGHADLPGRRGRLALFRQ